MLVFQTSAVVKTATIRFRDIQHTEHVHLRFAFYQMETKLLFSVLLTALSQDLSQTHWGFAQPNLSEMQPHHPTKNQATQCLGGEKKNSAEMMCEWLNKDLAPLLHLWHSLGKQQQKNTLLFSGRLILRLKKHPVLHTTVLEYTYANARTHTHRHTYRKWDKEC